MIFSNFYDCFMKFCTMYCSLDEKNYNPTITLNHNSQEMAPFFILARDAGIGALSCLSKSEKNKEAIMTTEIIPTLIQMIDQGTSFGR